MKKKRKKNRAFFNKLEQAIIKSHLLGCSVILEFDANSKLGPTLIPDDPHNQSANGKILEGIITRQGLILGNSLELSKGLITRHRSTINGEEISVIDFLLFSSELLPYVNSVTIDEERKYTLTRFGVEKGKKIIKESDHNPIFASFNFNVKNVNKERKEMFNLRNIECQAQFTSFTNSSNILSESIRDGESIEESFNRFYKNLTKIFHQTFKKVRIGSKSRPSENEDLMDERRKLMSKKDPVSLDKLKEIENKLVELTAKKNADIIKEEIDNLKNGDGEVDMLSFWKMKRKLFPKAKDIPTAMMDSRGHLVSSGQKIKDLYLKTYEERLKHRKIKEGLEEHQANREELFQHRIDETKKKQIIPWTMKQLEKVLRSLKKGKARDPLNLVNEIFRPEVAGADLKSALLKIVNKIKSDFFSLQTF